MLLLVLGAALVAAVIYDAVWTTLVLKGAGPLSGRVAASTWRALRRLHRPGSRHRLLALSGTIILLAILGLWLLGLLLGWTLVFAAAPGAVVDGRTGEPATLLQRIYFAGYTVTTLGIGDMVPTGPWRVLTVAAAMTGLVFITLSITYFVPLIEAVTDGRRLATFVAAMGRSPQDLLLNAWDGQRFEGLDVYFASLAGMLDAHTHQHHSYPVMHYFHSDDAESAVPLRLAVLDEALTLLRYGVARECRPAPLVLHTLHCAVTGYLRVVQAAYVAPASDPPPPPDLGPLRRAGIPLVDEEAFREALVALEGRRRLLRGLVEHDGWTWADVPLEHREGGLDHRPLGEETDGEPTPARPF